MMQYDEDGYYSMSRRGIQRVIRKLGELRKQQEKIFLSDLPLEDKTERIEKISLQMTTLSRETLEKIRVLEKRK